MKAVAEAAAMETAPYDAQRERKCHFLARLIDHSKDSVPMVSNWALKDWNRQERITFPIRPELTEC